MGFYGKLNEKLIARSLRQKGYSYKEILMKIKVSKGTLSVWLKDIPLTEDQKLRLMKNKQLGQHKASIIAAENKRKLRIEKTIRINELAKKEIGVLSKRDRFIAGIMLYAGEGDKGSYNTGFTNSNPEMIRFMMNWFREFCDLPETKYRGAIWIHQGLDAEKAKHYWSRLTRIPTAQFHKTYIAKDKPLSPKIRKNLHTYGIFAIRFSNSAIQRKILGWIKACVDVKITSVP